jgi:hypothetical protein
MKKKAAKDLRSFARQKQRLLRKVKVPDEGLPGSLSMSRIRCGKKKCSCTEGKGHENWTLTYMSEGSKRVKHIPTDLVEYVRLRVDQGKSFKEEVNEIFIANVELLELLRKQKAR